ncbi:unnamed protein product [Urochloa decumbens]|uniref:Cystatin domain-containing protein n=1 Tax=Urochloa decumbens TaxID=240449 RepID=A0ABC9G440_9POAL
MRASLLLAVAIVAIYVLSTPAMAVLEWIPVDSKDPQIEEYGKWAVQEHVKQTNDPIKFNKLVSADKKILIGFYFRLIIDASNNNGTDGKYQAVVHQMDWGEKLSLVSFNPAN